MEFTIREAAHNEASIIVTHRRRMFEAMKSGSPEQLDQLDAAFLPWVSERLANGRYHGFFAVAEDGRVVGGVGLWLVDWPPGPYDQKPFRGYIMDLYIDDAFRSHGLGRRLMRRAMDWAYSNNIHILMLHASDQGRPLYESLGFTPTNEMRTWRGREQSG